MRHKKLLFFLVFAASIFLSLAYLLFGDFFKQTRSLGLLGLFLINFASNATLFLPTPAFISVVVAGNIYPPILVGFIASLGATLGDAIGFIIGVSGRHLALNRLINNKWFKLLEIYFKKYGYVLVFVLSFIPNPFFDAIGLVAGIFKYSPLKFFITVFVGRFLRYYVFAKFGSMI